MHFGLLFVLPITHNKEGTFKIFSSSLAPEGVCLSSCKIPLNIILLLKVTISSSIAVTITQWLMERIIWTEEHTVSYHKYLKTNEPPQNTWNLRPGELVNGMSELDDHYIYYWGQESLRRNGVALIVNKRVQNAVLGCNLKNDRIISVSKANHSISE